MNAKGTFLKKKGERYHNFVVTRSLFIEELSCTLRELEHVPCGASLMHLECEDPENLFCLSFRTYPSSSNGAAHILEHTVLCGSEKFPVKDPFFAMTRRSLNTFMNALTGSDFTCYPAASQNEKDFYNLLSVYLDAVFHPRLGKMSFLQEGHHLEFTHPKDPATALQIKGIVFNEMKGSLSSLESRLWHTLMEHLLPDLPYAYNSGGDPKVIPHLTYEELLAFHNTYYHPSQCLFFFYGNIPLKTHLDYLEEHTLKHVKKHPCLPTLPLQKRFTSPLQREASYPAQELAEEERHTVVAFGFLTAPLLEQEEVLALCILDAILMDNDASLLKAILLSSGLCIHVDAYMDTDMSEVPYALIFKGCQRDKVDEIESVLMQALKQIAERGIPQEKVRAALHQLEFSRLEINTESAPFGLTLFMRSGLAKQHGCAPQRSLMVHSLFEELLAKISDPAYLPSLIKKHLIDNPHRVRLIMHPDPDLIRKETEQESRMLEQVRSSLSQEETKQIIKETEELSLFQKQMEGQSLECLPRVTLEDVNPKIRTFALESTQMGPLLFHHHECFTNHIAYVDLLFDLSALADEDLGYSHLLLCLLPELGCGKRDYKENLDYIQSHIGGIGFSYGLYNQVDDPKQMKPALLVRGKALESNLSHLFSLMQDFLNSPHLNDRARIEELLKKLRDALLHQLSRRAPRYALSLALSGLCASSYIQEHCHGLTYFKLIEALSKDPSSLVEKLMALKESLFSFHNVNLVLSSSRKVKDQILKEGAFGLERLCSKKPFLPYSPPSSIPSPSSQGRPIPSQVAYNVEAFSTISYLHPHSAALTTATMLMDNLILHKKVREQGGAYGCHAHYNSALGHFYFQSYRDPHIATSLATFHEAIDEIKAGHFTERELEEAKLGIIQHMDAPISPSNRALLAHSYLREGRTEKRRQEFRSRLLGLSSADIKRAIEEELFSQKKKGIFISFAGKELLEKESKGVARLGTSFPIVPI